MESALQTPGPSTIFGTSSKHKDPNPNFSFSPTSPRSTGPRDPASSPPPPPPAGRAYTHTPRSISESLAHPILTGAGLTRLPRPREELRDLTEAERLRVEWDILLRKKDKYKTWKKRTKDEWRELENAKVLMEANRQRLREDEMFILSEKRVIEEERAKLKEEMRAFKAVQKDVETQKLELEEQRFRLEEDRQGLIADLEKYHREREEYEDERRKHAEDIVNMRREREEMHRKHDEELRELNEMRHAFDEEKKMYEKERRIYLAVRQILDSNEDSDEVAHDAHV